MTPHMGAGSVTALCPGGIILEDKTMICLAGTVVKENAATADHGGGIFVRGGVLEVTARSRVEGNSCPLIGGGILGVQGARISIAGGAEVVGNRAAREGGGVALLGRSAEALGSTRLLVEDSTVEGNSAAYYSGGGISCDRSHVELVNASLVGNVAGSSGGGLISMLSSVFVSASLVQDNIALQGGGISVFGDSNTTSVLRMSKTSVLDNSAAEGGGLMMGAYSRALLLNTLAPQHLGAPSSDDGEANSSVAAAAICGEEWCGSVCLRRNSAAHAAAMSFSNSTGHILQGVVVADNFGVEESGPTSVMSLIGRSHVAVDGGHYRCNVGTGFHITDFSTVTMSDTLVFGQFLDPFEDEYYYWQVRTRSERGIPLNDSLDSQIATVE
eukprot:gene14335-16950_t